MSFVEKYFFGTPKMPRNLDISTFLEGAMYSDSSRLFPHPFLLTNLPLLRFQQSVFERATSRWVFAGDGNRNEIYDGAVSNAQASHDFCRRRYADGTWNEPARLFLNSIHRHFPFSAGEIEFTFEANPNELSKEKLHLLKEAGVNRLSFGVQTFDDELLKKIGRTHRRSDVFQIIETAKEMGFSNISIDLMYGLPGQTLEQLRDDLTFTFSLERSAYFCLFTHYWTKNGVL